MLAIHPTSRGFGWVLFEGQNAPVDWGIASAKAGRDMRLIRRCDHLLEKHEPAFLVLEAFEGSGTDRAGRIKALYRAFTGKAAARGVQTAVYRRKVVARALGLPDDASRHDVALAVAGRVAALSHRLPPKRKPWIAEDPRQSLFDAGALALTHYAATAMP